VSPDGPVSVAWKWYISLSERGKDVTQFRMVFIYLVVKAVKCGRRFCGQEKAHDVLSSQAQRRHGFTVESLPISTRTSFEDLYAAPHGQRHLDAFEERLQDNTQTPVPDQSRKRSGTKPFGRRLDHRGFLGFSRFALMSADVNSALKAGSKSD
jgi:hypothetical protein